VQQKPVVPIAQPKVPQSEPEKHDQPQKKQAHPMCSPQQPWSENQQHALALSSSPFEIPSRIHQKEKYEKAQIVSSYGRAARCRDSGRMLADRHEVT
jgi:hypothetical protein